MSEVPAAASAVGAITTHGSLKTDGAVPRPIADGGIPATTAGQAALTDRYVQQSGRIHLTGIQALARLPIDQSRRDRRRGARVGTYVSGYEGSPLAGYDLELLRQSRLLDENRIHFAQGLNEELAATAVQGSQLISPHGAMVDGVVGFWYAKAPGLDRATDALRHSNLMGTHPAGGVVALVGDDSGAKSSSVPSASERALADLGIPTFFPADAGEILSMGRHAVEMSRASGLWTALKIVTAVADGSASVILDDSAFEPVFPSGSHQHAPTAKLLQPVLAPLERDFVTKRMRIATEYVELNGLNQVTSRHPHDRVGVVAAGKTYLDTRQALLAIGISDAELEALGVRILKLGVVWPIPLEGLRDFAEGLEEILVIEEKRPFIETAIREALYGMASAPVISGKATADGRDLFPAYGELDAEAIARGLAARLAARGSKSAADWLDGHSQLAQRPLALLPMVDRAPYFCSGCPHNSSTKPRTDSLIGAGIGCHAMVLLMDEKQVGKTVGLTQMGGEGAQWLGMAPFVGGDHFVQNIGDGTFHHSGSLAIRAAVASGLNVTYRLLYNGTVAMTGGQDAVGQMTVSQLVENLRSEGVARVIVTTESVRRTRASGVPRDVDVWDRGRLDEAEQVLRATAGVTVLIHDQECATELRRKRKRGNAPRPSSSIVINHRICEGCGDCGEKSNCLSVHPIETEYGRKTAIHQRSCNADKTCLAGDCPAFMLVEHGAAAPPAVAVADLEPSDLPEVPRSDGQRDQQIRLMGIGGTGVVTTSQVLAAAAHLSGRYVRTLDQTGLAQKGGAVVSDVKISVGPIDAGNQIGSEACDLYLGYDLLVASHPKNVAVLSHDATAVISTSVVPTGAMVSDKTKSYPDVDSQVALIHERVYGGSLVRLDGLACAEHLLGAGQFANMLLVGVAYQLGALRLTWDALEEAIKLNGVDIERNLQAFRRGRQFVADPEAFHAAVRLTQRPGSHPGPQADSSRRHDVLAAATTPAGLESLIDARSAELERFQNADYARRYRRLVEEARRAEELAGLGRFTVAPAVAHYFFKLLAYKDEYEVARLALDPEVKAGIKAEFGSQARISWKLHPPTLRALGLRRKLTLGRWFTPVFIVLYSLRRIRGTLLDPFGHSQVRREERRLIDDYEATLSACLPRLDATTVDVITQLAMLPDVVRGYEHVKLRTIDQYDRRRQDLLDALETKP